MDITANAMIAALEDLISTMQAHLEEIKVDPTLVDSERWVEQVENDAHYATDFAGYAEAFKD